MITSYWKLKREVAQQRAALIEQSVELTRYRSLRGSDATANCDGPWQSRFAELDKEYQRLVKESSADRMDAIRWRRIKVELDL